VAVSEAQRFELHRQLQKTLGEDVAHSLMEYLPPLGWADVARRRDVEVVERRLNAAIGGGLALVLALLAIQVQTLLVVSEIAGKIG